MYVIIKHVFSTDWFAANIIITFYLIILFFKQFSIDWDGNKAKEARRKVEIKRTEKKEEGAGCTDDERVQ